MRLLAFAKERMEVRDGRVVTLRERLQHKPLMFAVWIYMNALEDRQQLKMENRKLTFENEGLRKVIVARNQTIGKLERRINTGQ